MPLYEFNCNPCGIGIEKLQAYDDPIPNCSKCGKPMLRGVGSIGIVYWKQGMPSAEPLIHNSHALSRAATRGWEMEAGIA